MSRSLPGDPEGVDEDVRSRTGVEELTRLRNPLSELLRAAESPSVVLGSAEREANSLNHIPFLGDDEPDDAVDASLLSLLPS